jgi:TBCC domain-containing protein 1
LSFPRTWSDRDLINLPIAQAGLTKDKERELNDAIQAHFREWLQNSSLLRQIYDLSNLERADEASNAALPVAGSGTAGIPPGGMAAAAAAAAATQSSQGSFLK